LVSYGNITKVASLTGIVSTKEGGMTNLNSKVVAG
jgi:hypothetical protein